MEVLYLAIVFSVIAVLVALRKPLNLALTVGIICTVLLFRMELPEALKVLGRQTVAWETIDLLVGFYVIVVLQLMLEKKGRLTQAKDAFNRLLRNRRINTIVSPAIMGLLPSAAVMTICADMVEETCGTYMDAKSKTFVACFYRHIPELFLPTFPVILLAMSLSGENVGVFILAMLPLAVLACLVVEVIYLRQIPREMPPLEEKVNKKREIFRLLRNLWPLILVLAIIIAGNLSAAFAGPIVIFINFFADHFQLNDLPKLLRKSVEPVMLCNMYLIMLFKSLLLHTGALLALPSFFAQLPISLTMSFLLLFFVGTVISGSQAIVAVGLPMAMAALPEGGLPLLVILMGTAWAAMELSPTHVCAFVAAECFHTTFMDIVVKALPSVLIFSALCYGYGQALALAL